MRGTHAGSTANHHGLVFFYFFLHLGQVVQGDVERLGGVSTLKFAGRTNVHHDGAVGHQLLVVHSWTHELFEKSKHGRQLHFVDLNVGPAAAVVQSFHAVGL